MKRLRVATTNRGKLREFRQILSPLGYQVDGIEELGLDIVEDGDTFAANAIIKARAVCEATGEAAVADDSGLEVTALDGRPGVYSARYAGTPGAGRDRANREKLLVEMREVPDAAREARFVCAIAYLEPNGEPELFHGFLAGTIGRESRGDNGFGYDPVFEVSKEGRTAAELSAEEKNAISHRGHAIRSLVEYLRSRE
jgi:XTP/dITP diphosphohydrolase